MITDMIVSGAMKLLALYGSFRRALAHAHARIQVRARVRSSHHKITPTGLTQAKFDKIQAANTESIRRGIEQAFALAELNGLDSLNPTQNQMEECHNPECIHPPMLLPPNTPTHMATCPGCPECQGELQGTLFDIDQDVHSHVRGQHKLDQ